MVVNRLILVKITSTENSTTNTARQLHLQVEEMYKTSFIILQRGPKKTNPACEKHRLNQVEYPVVIRVLFVGRYSCFKQHWLR